MHRSDRTNYIASLPWYSFPATRPILDTVWFDIANQLKQSGFDHCPDHLNYDASPLALLTCPTLVMSQCCGPELFLASAENVLPVAAPVISAYPVAAGKYYSYIVACNRRVVDEPVVAVNSYTSHSGCTAIKQWLSDNGVASFTTYESGSHARSVADVQSGRADLAAIDALSWQFLDTAGLQILDRSEPVSAPPFVTGIRSGIPGQEFVQALDSGFKRNGQALGIVGVVPADRSDYQDLATLGVS